MKIEVVIPAVRARLLAASLAFATLGGCAVPTGGSPAAAPKPSPAPDATAATTAAPELPLRAAPAAFPDSEVPRAAIAADTRLREIRSLVGRTREMDSIASSSKPVFESIESLKEWMHSRDPRQQTARALRSLGLEWRLDGELLAGWMEATGRRLDALTSARTELDDMDAAWAATEAQLAPDAAPDIHARSRTVRASVRETADRLHTEMDKVLLLQSGISAASLDVEEALDAIAGALREERKALLKIESPPIWRALKTGPGEGSLLQEIKSTFQDNVRALKQYAARESKRFAFHALLFFVVLVILVHLRPRSRSWPVSDKGLLACARLVQRPVLGAWLVALLCGRWIHVRAPLAMYELTAVLLTVPVVVLMRGIVAPRVRGALHALAVLFVAERLWESTWAGTFLERAGLLGLTVLTAALLVGSGHLSDPVPSVVTPGWWKVLRFVARSSLVALAVAFLSNVVGNATLARLLTVTVINVAYAGVTLYAAALLLRGAAELLIRSPAARASHTLAVHGDLILRRVSLAIDATSIVLFFVVVLSSTDLLGVVDDAVGDLLSRRWGVGEFRFSFATALVFVVTVFVSVMISRALRMVLESDVYPRIALPRGLPETLTMLLRYGVVSLGFLLALAVAGIPVDRLTVIFGALGVGIGFGLQAVVNNFVSGLILIFERPIQIGDAVEVSGLTGRVRSIGVRASTIETFDGAEVIVPNGTLVSNQLINWTLTSRKRRVEIPVGVAYGTDPDRVIKLLQDAAKGQPGVLDDPEPSALFRGFGPSSLDFSLYFWTADFENWTRARSDTMVRVSAALRDAGIAIPFPQQEVHVRKDPPGRP